MERRRRPARALRSATFIFPSDGGLAEAEAVFLAGCGLPEAWQGRDRFAIVRAWIRHWFERFGGLARLEKDTITACAIAYLDHRGIPACKAGRRARSCAHFPEVAELAARLLARWPVRAYAPQRLWFPEDGFALTCSPAKPKRFWRDMAGALRRLVPRRLRAGAKSRDVERRRCCADRAALRARRAAGDASPWRAMCGAGCEAAGFAVEKKPGFGAKRERLEARLRLPLRRRRRRGPRGALYPYAACYPKRVAIIGAGIAGAACAQALDAARRRDRRAGSGARRLGAGASGNPAGLVMPRLDRGGVLREFFLAGLPPCGRDL